jgi:glutamate-1-semialdehyde 2,1-aminomutase
MHNPQLKQARQHELQQRAAAVVPGGVYGHNRSKFLFPGAPQFWARGSGYLIWDVDGNEYVDLMCSWGPIVLGHQHPAVEEAAERQRRQQDTANGPGAVFVELAELLVASVEHADWCVLAKNGVDVTTLALTVARAATGRSTVLVARGAFHGALPWCSSRTAGVTAGDRAHLDYFEYNDTESLLASAERADGDLAAVIVTPHKHDAGTDQAPVAPAFAHAVRALCDHVGAVLILDEVRTGFRVAYGSSWEQLGVGPDLTCWSKAIANGHPISALLGSDALRDAAARVAIGGTFWTSSVPMAAALATLAVLRNEDGSAQMAATGRQIITGLGQAADSHGLPVRFSGPPCMPYLSFQDDEGLRLAKRWATEMARHGVYLNPSHNWFMSTALDATAVDRVLRAADQAFAVVSAEF